MATQDIKDFLFEQTGVAQSHWKRMSKSTTSTGELIRIFENKHSGEHIQTVESVDGTIRIVKEPIDAAPNERAELKKAKKLIDNFFENAQTPDPSLPEYALIPKWFNFSFYGNVDHDLDEFVNSNTPEDSVTGFTVFFSLKNNTEGMCEHIEKLVGSFLPDFMQEVEESSFAIHPEVMTIYDNERLEGIANGSIPNVPYNAFVALLESSGFHYDIKNCPLASFGGSEGCPPLGKTSPKP